MRLFLAHCEFIEYKPIMKEIKYAENSEKRVYRFENVLVVFTCIEKDDNEEKVEKASMEIKSSLKDLGINKVLVYPFAHLSNNLKKPSEALELIKLFVKKMEELNIEVYKAPFGWTKELHLKIKGHPLAERSKFF